MSKNRQILWAMFGCFVGHFFGKYVQIRGLKAPGNYSHQFWSNKCSILLLERPKPQNFMISGLLSPGETLFIDLNMPNYFKHVRKHGNYFEQTSTLKTLGKIKSVVTILTHSIRVVASDCRQSGSLTSQGPKT